MTQHKKPLMAMQALMLRQVVINNGKAESTH
nr:MAG TPA: hypothetical protein [Bacteriophage sp.]